jgi:hypothetical protein
VVARQRIGDAKGPACEGFQAVAAAAMTISAGAVAWELRKSREKQQYCWPFGPT